MLEFHPLANLFPLLEGAEFEALVADIKANGIHDEIVMHEGKILDGRNRYRAGIAAGVIEADIDGKPGWIFAEYERDIFVEGNAPKPLDWVLSKNLHRRHLSESQRAMVAAKLANMPSGTRTDLEPRANLHEVSADEAAEKLNVSPRSVKTAKSVQRDGAPELIEAVETGEVAVSAAAELAKLPADEQAEILRTADPKALAKLAKERRHERAGDSGASVNGARSIMAGRREPDDSLDYFPTPPWATRALLEDVLPHLGIDPFKLGFVWEPACGEGHISGVLAEYGLAVTATDIFDYSVDGWQPPGWAETFDFLDDDAVVPISADWIITNPPFGDKALPFVLDALALARTGVAMFFRQQWLEGIERYEDLFEHQPPTLYAQFTERVNLCKGRWDPAGTTATAYCWLVWIKDMGPQPVFWIPPGRRSEHFRADDEARFTAHPVVAPSASLIAEIKAASSAFPTALSDPPTALSDPPTALSDPPTPNPSPRGGRGIEAAATGDLNGIIRDGYGRNAPLAELARQTGLSAMAVKSRAKRMGLGDPARQRQAVAASNRRRSKSGGGPE
jgi:hypothetical protein